MTPTSDSSSIGPYPEFDVLRNDDPCDDFSPPQNVQTVCNDTPKSSVKAQTYGTVKKRRKRRSRVHNQVNTIFKITHSELCTLSNTGNINTKYFLVHILKLVTCLDLRCFCFRHRGERVPLWRSRTQYCQRLWHGLLKVIVYILVFFLM